MALSVVFAWMMLIVALKHSIWRSWKDKSARHRKFGLFLDVALVMAGAVISVTYLIELEAVCLIDVLTGDRTRLMAEALQSEIEYSEMMGLPIPDSADDPACLNTTHALLPLILFGAVVIFLAYNIKVWGLPLVLVSILIATYTFLTVMNWYFFGPDGQNKYLVTILSSEEVRSLTSGREFVRDALVNNTSGLLGRFINILMLLVFPYIVLGALFGGVRGQALIKLAFADAQPSWRTGACRRCLVGHVRHDHRRPGCECSFDGRPDHSDDAETRFFAGVRRRRRGGGLVRRLDHAAHHGGGRLYHGGTDGCSLP